MSGTKRNRKKDESRLDDARIPLRRDLAIRAAKIAERITGDLCVSEYHGGKGGIHLYRIVRVDVEGREKLA